MTRPSLASRLGGGGGGAAGGHGGDGMRWLLTYADMITLLLALFLILFAISNVSGVKLARLAKAFSGSFNAASPIDGETKQRAAAGVQDRGGAGDQHIKDEADLAAIKARIDTYIREHHLQDQVRTRLDAQGFAITLLGDHAYYDSGSAALRPVTKKLLDALAVQLRTVKNDVRVEGDTDNVPIATAAYPTNWELSGARAIVVTRYLVERQRVRPERLSFAGYGEYRPKFPNDTEAHREQNRRIAILVLKKVR